MPGDEAEVTMNTSEAGAPKNNHSTLIILRLQIRVVEELVLFGLLIRLVIFAPLFVEMHLSRKTEGIGPMTSWQPLH